MMGHPAWQRPLMPKQKGYAVRQNDWPKRPPKITEGTFAAVIRAYLASPIYRALAPETQRNYRVLLGMAENPEALGGLSTLVIRPSLVQGFLDGLARTPGRQKNARVALKAVEKFALVRDLLPYPIMTGTETIKMDGGHEPWSDDMVRVAIEHARPDLARAVLLAVESGQRGSDIIKMRWSDLEDQIDPLTGNAHTGIHVIQKKTGVRLWIPFTQALSAAIEIWRPTRRPPFFLVLRADGTPFDRNALSWAWNQERAQNPALAPLEAAGLVMHGLRATAVVRARQRGATVLQISSMFGMHEAQVARYSRLADQREMAMAAVYHIDGQRRASRDAKPREQT
jgi:integrase